MYFAHLYAVAQLPHRASALRYLFFGLFYYSIISGFFGLYATDNFRNLAAADSSYLKPLAGNIFGFFCMFFLLVGLIPLGPSGMAKSSYSSMFFLAAVALAIAGAITLWTLKDNGFNSGDANTLRPFFFSSIQSTIGVLPILAIAVFGASHDAAHAAVVIICLDSFWSLSNLFGAKIQWDINHFYPNEQINQMTAGFVLCLLSSVFSFFTALTGIIDSNQTVSKIPK